MHYVIYRTDNSGTRKWALFTDQATADDNMARWQRREDANQYRPYGPVSFYMEHETETENA